VEGVVQESERDPNFKFEIAKTPQGRTILWCVQCGMCSSNCPYSDIWKTKAHQVMAMVHLGLRDQALSSEAIWTCATCFMCTERCPQGVEITNVMFALKNIATRERGAPEGYKLFGQQVYKTGRGAEITTLRERERAKMGLPEIPEVNITSIRKILEKTKISELVDGSEEKE